MYPETTLNLSTTTLTEGLNKEFEIRTLVTPETLVRTVYVFRTKSREDATKWARTIEKPFLQSKLFLF